MRNEGNDFGKDRDQLQETAEFNQVSYDFLQKGRWNVKKFKEKKTKNSYSHMGFKLIFTTQDITSKWSKKTSSQNSAEV